MSTPIDSLNSDYTSKSEDSVPLRLGSPIASEFLHSYHSRSPSQSPGRSIIFRRDSEPGPDHLTELRERINRLEEQRLQLTSTHNEQVTSLEGEVARWRDEAERGEATRQRLEYELAVLKKALNREKETARENVRQLKASLQKHQVDNADLTEKADSLTKSLHLREDEMLQVINTLKKELSEKETEIKSLEDAKSKIQKDKEQVERVFAEQENLYSSAQEKLATLRMERDTQTENVRRQLKELQYSTEREERFRKEMEVALTKIKSLEESTEAERAAHLETKFNSELIQLRVRDMQGALEVEKAGRGDLVLKTEAMTKKISDLEALYNQENTTALGLRTQLERAEGELNTLKTRLSSEMDGKHAMVTDMSEQLEIHQQSFSELKEELKKAKKRQAYLEDTYGGSMRELEILVNNFQQKSFVKKNRGQQIDALSPSEVLERLRETMNDFQKRLNNASKEMTKLKGTYEKIQGECEQYKEVMWKQDKSNKDLQKKYSSTSKELEKVRQLYREHQTEATALKVALHRAEQDRHSEKSKGQDLTDEFIRRLKALEDQLEDRKVYLHGLHERLRSGPDIPGLSDVKLSEPVNWGHLSGAVQEHVAALMIAFIQANVKVSQLTATVQNKDDLLHRTQEAHEDSLRRLREDGEQREKEWSAQRSKMEKRYERQLADLKSKAKKTEETAHTAWQSAQTVTTVKGKLEMTCQYYQEQIAAMKNKLNSALIGCSLLLGSLWVHRAQVVDLVKQRELLSVQVDRFYELRRQLEEFVATVSSTMDGRDVDKTKTRPLLTFRIAVITVLAANRLCYLASLKSATQGNSRKPEVSPSLPIYIWPTCLSKQHIERSVPFIGCGVHRQPLSLWVGEDELLAAIEESVSQMKGDLNTQDKDGNQLLPQSAHQCLNKLLSRVESTLSLQLIQGYPSSNLGRLPQDNGCMLVRLLANGLHRALTIYSGQGGVVDCSAQETLSTLKKQFVSFTKRLHSAEVERRSLRAQVSRSREEDRVALQTEQRAESLKRELAAMNEKMKNLVDKDKFDSVYGELTRALQREQEAQRVLNEQNDQLGQLNLRLNVQTTDDIEKERTIAKAVQGLSDATTDLRQRDQTIQQLKRKVSNMEDQEQNLRDRMREMENRMKEKTKDKDALILYLKTLESTVDKAKRNLLHKPDSRAYEAVFNQLLASASITNIDLKEPEANTIQSLLQAFVDAQKTAVSRIGMLEEEILSHKQHINSLKKELGAVCRRERDADETLRPFNDPTGVLSSFPSLSSKVIGQSMGYSYQAERSYGEEFVPLRETMDYSAQHHQRYDPDKATKGAVNVR